MKQTSAIVLALLFGATNAVQNRYKPVFDGSRVAEDPLNSVTAVRGPPTASIGDTVYDAAMSATSGIPDDRSKSHAPSSLIQLQKRTKVDPISPENYDPWVYRFSKENMPPYPQWQTMDDGPPPEDEPSDSMAQVHKKHKKHHKRARSHSHHKRPDVAERGMDEEVHGFVVDALPPLNTRVRSTQPFIPNGSDDKAWESSALSEHKHKKHYKHHKRPDVAERGMDEEVHGFVTDALPPLNTRVRSTEPFIPNGSDPRAHESSAFSERKHHHKHHKRPDVAERGMDEEVHGFVTDALPPLNTRVRSTQPFIPNGSDPKAHEGAALSERRHHRKHHKKPDVAERGMDEEVHGFVTDALPPLNTRVRSTEPFIPNGSDPRAHESSAFSEKSHHHKHHHKHHKRPDIAERGMDEEVHGFVSDALPPLNTRVRSTEPFIPNGSDEKAHEGAALAQKKPDIAERGMDESVWGFATENLPPMNVRERKQKDLPFIPNGSNPKAFEGAASFAQAYKTDISENNIDGVVHDFVYDHVTPLNTWERSTKGYAPNGSSPRAFEGSASLAEIQKRDISENNVDGNIHSFVYDHVTPLNTWERSSYSYAPNGSSDQAFQGSASLAQAKPDVAGRDMDGAVHKFVYNNVTPLNAWERVDYAYAPNGSSDKSFEGSAAALSQY